jgi:hypothetical protein
MKVTAYISGQSIMADPPTKMLGVGSIIPDLKKTCFYKMLHRASDLQALVNMVMNLRVP